MKKVLGAAIAAGLLWALPARAQFPDSVPENIRFRIGGIYANLNQVATLSETGPPGVSIDLNNVLGQPNHKFAFRGDGSWNFAGSSYLDFGFLNISSDRSKTITRDINFGGVTYTAGAEVASEEQSRYIYGAYRYNFFKNPSFHLGLSLGLSYTTLRAMLSASAGVVGPGGPIVGGTTSREAEINAPVPLVGLDTEVAIAQPVSIGLWVRLFKANIDPYSGSMVNGMAHVDWYINQNFGLGLGYEYNKINIEKTNAPRFAKFDYRYDGPRFYVVVTF